MRYPRPVAHDTCLGLFRVPDARVAHRVLWTMSDRAIPVKYRAMQGFGVHTFRMVNAEASRCSASFIWRSGLWGIFSLVWDEAQKLAGKDPDFQTAKNLWEDIPEWR